MRVGEMLNPTDLGSQNIGDDKFRCRFHAHFYSMDASISNQVRNVQSFDSRSLSLIVKGKAGTLRVRRISTFHIVGLFLDQIINAG